MTDNSTQLKSVKFEPIVTWPFHDDKPIVMIIGQNPGRQRLNAQTYTAWEGNRSGDFMQEIVRDIPQVYLTNICNYQNMTPKKIKDGKLDLLAYYSEHNVKRVICVGLFAAKHAKDAGLPVDVIMHHPSFILRFNKNKEAYKKALRKEIKR